MNASIRQIRDENKRFEAMHHERSQELPLKQWLQEEGERCGLTAHAIRLRLSKGKYPGLKLRRINARVVFVRGGMR